MNLSFSTKRLNVIEIDASSSKVEHHQLTIALPTILTPAVVANLPGYFQGIDSIAAAEKWLANMLNECRLLMLQSKHQEVVGLLFIYTEKHDAHIGYLLAEQYWGQGLAFELLQGFINLAGTQSHWHKLIAGVDESNIPSINLLKKLAFEEQAPKENGMLFYEFNLNHGIQ
ncbi:GNAT family N-acetyltransferase [Pseudoalteromonas shioyasakiensis]|uniref:GNAT family N-acetyltransferase n=1 Tax=Pseudoalteromonas shioyasakiensis TaxID=1190813 RepID=A0ABT6TWT4_9GAMM|nr:MULTISPECIES: GNAT family N-acetyltransferase [Pseudoalteromonas]MDI4668230.1 GNAT family N-acetyltransferase [Pseudoalteromonas shioyasakiensis]MDI4672540.1 GNAT family N-acetyltransferase [Pseudoalteromonas shioyasakiensis]MDI4684604.1 GNAT family N-acetyltransferase [Pseudoalteromonas shioyasakiensis]MDI4703432.1 GNAT family N-acetyltransferase [Pseudoalteromonas shioyasakiensis]NUJ19941.1 GNAT family N-acetyltransferase [Pseudoalteromonas sp. 0802]